MKRKIIVFSILFLGLILITLFSIGAGSVSSGLKETCSVLMGNKENEVLYNIIWQIRIPRVIAAVILGGALSVAGFLLQTFFLNPIAGPYVLGVSSGAKLVVAITMIFSLKMGVILNSWMLIGAAFIGALISMGIVLLISFRIKSMSILVVCGIMIGYICSAVTEILVTFASDSNIVNLHNWSQGSFSGISWENDRLILILVFISLFITAFYIKPINAYRLGERYASSLGVNIRGLKIALIILSSLLAAVVTAFAGPVSFVGIAVPHLMRRAFKTGKPSVLIFGCFFGGAIVTLFSDTMARLIFAPLELSISTVTAVLLAPVVVVMMIRKHKAGDRF